MITLQILKNGYEKNILDPANPGDFGYDLIAATEPKIIGKQDNEDIGLYHYIDYIEYDTNLIIEPVDGYGGFSYKETEDVLASLIFPRSSISKYNLVLANSVPIIDQGYRSSVKLRFKYIIQPCDLCMFNSNTLVTMVDLSKIYTKGNKIAQLICVRRELLNIEYVDKLEETARGNSGFGGSGI